MSVKVVITAVRLQGTTLVHVICAGASCECISINTTWEFNIFWGKDRWEIYFTSEFCGFWTVFILQMNLRAVWLVEVGEGMNGRYRSRHSFIHIVAARKFFSDWV